MNLIDFKEHFIGFRGYKNPINFLNRKKLIKEFSKKNKKIKNDWTKTFVNFTKYQPEQFEIIEQFFNSSIDIKIKNVKNDQSIILICVVKNDLVKIKQMVKYHRSIGLKHFVYIDNMSTDGTVEWLEKQKDVDVFEVQERYTTNRREAWINRIIDYYGFNRWYLILDSDELFSYIDIEEIEISEFTSKIKNNGYTRARALMVDMYGQSDFYKSDDEELYVSKCIYFDIDSYEQKNSKYLDLITGGPRNRLFETNSWLTKYPLVYFEEGDVQGNSHYPFPYNKNKETPCFSIIKHYKFLPSDINKYRKIAENNNYYNGSVEYKKYIKKIDNTDTLDFFYKGTVKFSNSESLKYIDFIEKVE